MWSGDSRIYLVRDGEITQLSRDHTEVQELVAEGAHARGGAGPGPAATSSPARSASHDDPELEIASGAAAAGDVFVICSDGLTAHVEDDEILRHA